MLWYLLALSILAADAAATNAPRHPDAVQVFPRPNSQAWPDENYDHFPDGWSRRQGPGFPHYLKIELTQPQSTDDKPALKINLDGGAAAIYSPPIEVGSEFSYVLECMTRTEGLKHDEAFISITFHDANRAVVGTFYSERIRESPQWIKLRVGPVAPPSADAVFAVIGLHLQPTEKSDIRGSASFQDIWFAHLPRMTVETQHLRTILEASERIELLCKVSGILERDPLITFELVDIAQRGIDKSSQRLQGVRVQRKTFKAAQVPGLIRQDTQGYTGELRWSPSRVEPGFYRVRVTMQGGKTGVGALVQQRELTFVVVRGERPPARGEFGWSLPESDRKLPLTVLAEIVPHGGISWVKLPVWHAHTELARSKQLIRFAERLQAHGIRLVGLLDQPPADLRKQYGEAKTLFAADIFSADPELWYRSLEPVMTRLSSKIYWWQLGLDSDQSFVGYPNVAAKVAEVKKQLERFGQQAHLGIGWRWTHEIPAAADAPWSFLPLAADPSLTAAELATYLAASKSAATRRWVLVDPLPSDVYPLETRAIDLVQRMIAAKIHGAEGIFVSNPFHPQTGLMHEDGAPGELLLTWRTAAMALSGARYLGTTELPGGSRNHLFTRGHDAVMVTWNDRPTAERASLGKQIQLIDIWGRVQTPKHAGDEHLIDVGPLPTFVTGIHEGIARTQMSFAFAESRLPSLFGKPYRTSFRATNHFPQGVGGTITIQLPKEWRRTIPAVSMKLAAGEELVKEFDFPMSYDASNGKHLLRVDFDIQADERYQFSIHRQIEIGLGDIEINILTQLTPEGVLVVRQEMVNNTDQVVDFKCYLSTPSERRRRNQVYRLARGKDIKYYRYANGRDLIGQAFWLKAEETDGPRVLNYRFTATE
jgi:hypothetical protein